MNIEKRYLQSMMFQAVVTDSNFYDHTKLEFLTLQDIDEFVEFRKQETQLIYNQYMKAYDEQI